MPDVSVCVLGPLEVRLDGEPVDLGAPKQRAVLALLAVNRGRAVSLDQLIEELWGDQAPPRATASLQAYVSNLRRVLEPDRAPRTPATVLVSRPPGYALDVPAERFDVEQFEVLRSQAARALSDGRPHDAVDAGRAGLAVWRGEVLEDFRYDHFADEARAGLDDARVDLAATVAAALLASGRPEEAATDLSALVRAHPLRERLWELLMVAQYRSGRQAEALRTFQQAREVLAEELGLDPGPALRRLEQQVLAQDPALDLAAAVPVAAAPSVATPSHATRSSVPAPDHGSDLVGRTVERATLLAAVDAAAAGRTGFVLVSGEAGIGKTALVESVGPVLAEQGLAVHIGRSFEQAGSAPLWPWAQVVRSILGDRPAERAAAWLGGRAAQLAPLLPGEIDGAPIAPGDPDGVDRLRLFDTVASVLDAAAAEHPVVVVLDDLHWADADSLALLDFLATERRATPLAVVATYREDEAAPGTRLADALGSLARHSTPTRIELSGLAREDVAAYAARLAGGGVDAATVDVLESQTAGNPFFLGELVRLLASEKRLDAERAAEQVPSGVRDVVRRRLDRLPDDSQAVLRIAAIVGRTFGLDVLAASCELDLDAVLDALEPPVISGLVVETGVGGEQFGFAHALVGAALAEDVPATRRRRLHARVAQAIEAVHAVDLDAVAAQLAHHYGEAMAIGYAAPAGEFAERAARRAAAQGAFLEAARLWRVARAATDLDPDATVERRIDIDTELAVALSRIASGESLDIVADVVARAVSIGDVARGVRAALSLTEHSTSWSWAEFRTHPLHVTSQLEALLDLIGEGDSPERAAVLSTLACGAYYVDPDASFEVGEAGVAMARRLGDDVLLARCLSVHLVALERPDRVQALTAACDELIDLGTRLGDLRSVAVGLAARMSARLEVCDVVGADHDLRRAVELLAVHPVPALEQQVAVYPPMRAVLAGDLAGAEALAIRAYEGGRLRSMWMAEPTYLTHLVEIRREQGRLDEVEELIHAIAAEERQGARNLRALPAIQRGDLDRAREIVAENGGVLPIVQRDWRWVGEAVWGVDVATALGDVDACRYYLALFEPLSGVLTRTGTLISVSGPVDLYLGRLHAALGDDEAARRSFEASLATCRSIGAPGWEAHSLIGLGGVIGGDEGAALIREGRDVAERLGMRPAVDLADSLLMD